VLQTREIKSRQSKRRLVFNKMASRERASRVGAGVGDLRERAGQRGVRNRGLEEVGGAVAGALEGERVGVDALERGEDFYSSLAFSDI